MRLFTALLTLLGPLYFSGCIFLSIPISFQTPDYREVVLQDGPKSAKILVLDVDGVINSGTISPGGILNRGDSTVNAVAQKLRQAREDKNIKAVVLRVDTPGGGVTASDVVYELIRDYREETGIPIYVSMMDLATSGGYYISMAADEIYAHPTTITGSIGVIAMFPQFENLGHKIGLYFEVVKSGENKDITGGFHNMTPEQRAIMQTTIDELYVRFFEIVKQGRPNLPAETLGESRDGRIYTAKQASDNGLVDGIMYLSEVIEHARERAGVEAARVILYRQTSLSNYDSIYAKSEPLPSMQDNQQQNTNIGLINLDATAQAPEKPVFNYLWVP